MKRRIPHGGLNRCTAVALNAISVHFGLTPIQECDVPVDGAGLLSSITRIGLTYRIDWDAEGKTVRAFAKSHQEGAWYLAVTGHAMALINGELIDTTKRGKDGRRIIVAARVYNRRENPMKKRRIRQNIYGNWKGYVGRKMVWDFGVDEVQAEAWLATGLTDSRSEEGARAWLEASERVQKRKYGSNPMKQFREPFHVNFHSERGEVSIHVTDADDNEVWYADTDMVNELIEDGFLDSRGFIMGRNVRPDVLERSVISYLRSVGIIADRSEKPSRHAPLPTTVYDDARDLYDENPCGHRRNPGDIHIDIQSHNTRGSHVRAKNPLSIQLGDRVIDREMPQEGVMTVIGFADGGETVKVQYRNGTTDLVGREFLRVVFPEHGRRENPTREDVDGWVDHYRESMEKRIDGVPEKAHYVVKIVTKDGQDAWLRVGKGTKFDTDPAKARVYRNGDKANEAATKVANWLKKKQPAKWKKIATISAEPKK